MYRFYVSQEQIEEKQIHIVDSDVNHIKNVLRLEKGDWIVACDAEGTDYVCRIQEMSGTEITVSVEKNTGKRYRAGHQNYPVSGNTQERKNGIYHSEGRGAGCL